jgi:hypothetical protein
MSFGRSYSDTPHSVGLLWTSDRPVAETSTCTSHNTHRRQTFLPPAGLETAIPASDRPQTHVLESSATGIGHVRITEVEKAHILTECEFWNFVVLRDSMDTVLIWQYLFCGKYRSHRHATDSIVIVSWYIQVACTVPVLQQCELTHTEYW